MKLFTTALLASAATAIQLGEKHTSPSVAILPYVPDGHYDYLRSYGSHYSPYHKVQVIGQKPRSHTSHSYHPTTHTSYAPVKKSYTSTKYK